MRNAQFSHSAHDAAQKTFTGFVAHVKRELDAAKPHLNPAIALYVKLKPQVEKMTLLDLQFHSAEMETAARDGASEAEKVKQLIAAFDGLAPEPLRSVPIGF